MHPLVAEHRQALAEICRQYGVARLKVSGSAARGTDFDPDRSDADFLVVFEPGAERDLSRCSIWRMTLRR